MLATIAKAVNCIITEVVTNAVAIDINVSITVAGYIANCITNFITNYTRSVTITYMQALAILVFLGRFQSWTYQALFLLVEGLDINVD